jgi:putative membrane protein
MYGLPPGGLGSSEIMAGFLADYKNVFLALHIISFISWMAGMLYLPRLFVYHTTADAGSEMSETFKIMEGRLLKGIINPAMIATWVFGLALLWSQEFAQLTQGWMIAKLVCVLLLSGVHGLYVGNVRRFANDTNDMSQKYFRYLNEVPTLLMIVIVVLVIVVGRS